MNRAFVVFILVLLLSPLSILTDQYAAERHSNIDASFSRSTPELLIPGATQYSFNFWRWGKVTPQWRDTYEVLLEAEMIADSWGFAGQAGANASPHTVVS